ncbi:MAG: glycosyltransferase family 4 protein [Candidatus Woesearchaeota archaeon]
MRIACVSCSFNLPGGWKYYNFFETMSRRHKLEISMFTVQDWNGYNDKQLDSLKDISCNVRKFWSIKFSKPNSQYKYLPPSLLPRLIYMQPDIIYAMDEPPALSSFAACLAAKITGASLVLSSWENIQKNWFFPLSVGEHWILSRSALIVAGTEDVRQVYLAKGVDSLRIITLPISGVDPTLFKPDAKRSAKSTTVLFLGRLLKMKGIETILRARKLLNREGRKYKYLFVGSGDMFDTLRKLQRKESDIKVVEWLPPAELIKIYNESAVFVYPSIPSGYWIEQFGFSMAEALCCEVPVIATDVSGPRSIVTNRKSGFLIKIDDAKELASKIDLLMKDKVLRSRMGRYGRRDMMRRYTNNIVGDILYKSFLKLKR